MPSANITALTNAAAFLPDALFYMAASPFGVTDDRKITGSTLFTTIAPLNNNTAALVVTNSTTPTVPQVVFTNQAGTRRMQIAMAGNPSITDTFDNVSIYNAVASTGISLGLWNNIDEGLAAELYLYGGTNGTNHMRLRSTAAGAAGANWFDIANSGMLMTSNATPGGLILMAQTTAPIVFVTGGSALTDEKGRFDAAGFTLGKVSSITGALNLANAASAFLTTITAGNAAAARTYVWPTNFGSAGDVLTDAAGNGILSWAAGGGGGAGFNLGGAQIVTNTTQAINDNTLTPITFHAVEWDTNSFWSGGSPTHINFATTGKYQIDVQVSWENPGSGQYIAQARLNGVGGANEFLARDFRAESAPGSAGVAVSFSFIFDATSGDFIQIEAFQTSGSPTNLSGAAGIQSPACRVWVAALFDTSGSGGTAPQVRVTNSADQSIADNTPTLLGFDTDIFDSDSMHFTSSAALTGTVSKNGTTAVTGAGTSFTTELSVGQVIMIPGGGGNERRVVTAIADNTNLTVSTAFANTAAAQVGVRQNGCLVARTAGTYQISAAIGFATSGGGTRFATIALNANTATANVIGSEGGSAPSGSTACVVSTSTLWQLAQWDFVDVRVYQNSGGPLNVVAAPNETAEFMMIRISSS